MKKTSHPLGTKNPVIPDGVPTNIIHTKMIKPKKAPNQRLIAPIPKDIGEYKWFNPKHMVPVQIESMDKLYSKYSIGSKLGFVMMVFFAVVFYAGFCILYITHMVQGRRFFKRHFDEILNARFNQNMMAAQEKVVQHDDDLNSYNYVLKKTHETEMGIYKTLGYLWRLVNIENGKWFHDEEKIPKDKEKTSSEELNEIKKDSFFNSAGNYIVSTIPAATNISYNFNKVVPDYAERGLVQNSLIAAFKSFRNQEYKFLENKNDSTEKSKKKESCCQIFCGCIGTFCSIITCIWCCLQCCKKKPEKKMTDKELGKLVHESNQFTEENPYLDPPVKLTDTFATISNKNEKKTKKLAEQKAKRPDAQAVIDGKTPVVDDYDSQSNQKVQSIFDEVPKDLTIDNQQLFTRQFSKFEFGKRSMQRLDFGYIKQTAGSTKKVYNYKNPYATLMLSEPMLEIEDAKVENNYRYFEVEVLNLEPLGNIIIGFVNEDEYFNSLKVDSGAKPVSSMAGIDNPCYIVGRQKNSVSFELRKGEVWKNQQLITKYNNEVNLRNLYDKKDKDEFNFIGDTIGIGNIFLFLKFQVLI